MSLPELIFSSHDGRTIHKLQISGGKRTFLRFLSCYLGTCKFHENIDEAAKYLEILS